MSVNMLVLSLLHYFKIMQKSEIIQMQEAEKNYWWHVSRRFILKSVLKRFLRSKDNKILDIGCGTGINLIWLKDFGKVLGVDNNPKAVELCNKHGKAVLGNAVNPPIENNSCNLIAAFDVLEHLEDDRKALSNWEGILEDDGYLFLSVPAYQWLFGPHDKNLMHYRRYSLGQLVDLLKQVNLKPIYCSYFFIFTFPMFMLQRIISQVLNKSPGYTKTPSFINNFLIVLSKIEAWLMKFISLPFGSSILILARKNDQTNS